MTGSDNVIFSVWAPQCERVRIVVDGAVHPMESVGDGWWAAPVDGTDYAFLLDDDETPLPDPRSAWQPAGVHGPSRVYSHDAFDWTDTSWTGRALPGSVLYELHVGTFTPEGTFDAALERLDHLVALGVDLVEVMPVNAVDGPWNWGYDGVGWFAVTSNYGGPDAFKRFVDACHGRGLGVVLDVVHNHLGPSGAYLDRFGPYFAGRNIWGPSLNLDGPGSHEVRRYAIDNALMWLRDFHLDGLRLDAVHALADSSEVHLLEEMATEVDALATALRRPLSLIAESDLNDPKMITSRDGGGYGMTAQWTDDVHHCLHTALTGERQGYYADFADAGLDGLAKVLTHAFFHDGTFSSFRDRPHGSPVDRRRVPGHRFVVSLQNHDQVGNRAVGDRISASVSPGLLACGAALMLCSPFTPMLFMGEEWGATTPFQFFSQMPDPDLREAIRSGRLAEFAEHGWSADEVPDPNAEQTFLDSKLDWSQVGSDQHGWLLGTYRSLIALRRAEPALSDPRLDRVAVDVAGDLVVLHRGALRVAVNLGSAPVVPAWWDRVADVLLRSDAADGPGVPGTSFAVVRVSG